MPEQKNIYFYRDYPDFELYREDVSRWNLDHKKLDIKKFYGYNAIIDVGDVQIVRTALSGTFDHNGMGPPGYRTFLMPANYQQNYYWLNRKVESNVLPFFARNGIIDGISYDNFEIYTISIKEEHLNNVINEFKFLKVDKNIDNAERLFPINKVFVYYINTYLEIIFSRLQSNPEILHSPSFLYSIKFNLLYKILYFLEKKEVVPMPVPNRKRDQAVHKSTSYISENLNQRISLKRLTEVANVSERTLEYAFLERYGVTPKRYIQLQKLNKIRAELLYNSNKEFISNIAEKYGFKHMGQFSADYKTLFGEKPSTTIAKLKV